VICISTVHSQHGHFVNIPLADLDYIQSRGKALHLDRRLDIGNTRQLVTPLTQLWRRPRLPVIVRTRLPISHRRHKLFHERLERLWPMTVSLGVLEQPFLQLQLFLCCCRNWGIAGVDDESRVFTLGRHVVMRSSRIPYCIRMEISVRTLSPAVRLGLQRTRSPGSQLTLTHS
jgi:hypothetical protein